MPRACCEPAAPASAGMFQSPKQGWAGGSLGIFQVHPNTAPGVLTQPPAGETEARTALLPPARPTRALLHPSSVWVRMPRARCHPGTRQRRRTLPASVSPLLAGNRWGMLSLPAQLCPPRGLPRQGLPCRGRKEGGKRREGSCPDSEPAPPGSSRWHRPGHAGGRWQPFPARSLPPCSRQDELHVFPALCKAPGWRPSCHTPFFGLFFPL